MNIKNFKYAIIILTFLFFGTIYYLTILENENNLSNNLYDVKDLINVSHYSYDGIEFIKYEGDFDFLRTDYEEVYFYGKVEFSAHSNKFVLAKTINAEVSLYQSNDFFDGKDPVNLTNNVIVTDDYDVSFFNLGDYQGSYVLFEIKKVHKNNQMNILAYNSVSQTNLYNYIVKFLQTHLVILGVALGCIFLISTVMFYKIYRQYFLNVLLIILLLIMLLYISTTTYFKYHIYALEDAWYYASHLAILFLNTTVYYYSSLMERGATRKLSKIFLYTSMIITIIIFRNISFESLNAQSLHNEVSISLIIFSLFNIILLFNVILNNINIFKERNIFKNVLTIKKIFLCFILLYVLDINVWITLSNIGVITKNQLIGSSSRTFLIIYFVSLLLVSNHLAILKNNFIEMPKTLKSSKNILNNLSKQQAVLYNKENTEDFILTVFKSAEKLCKCKLSGYYLIKESGQEKKIIQGYGKFQNYKNMPYYLLPKNEKYNVKKGWHLFNKASRYEDIETELCALPDKTLSPNDILILKTFFNIAYDVIFNFILLKNMFDEEKELVYSLTEISEIRSKETGNHIKRVSEYCKILGSKFGLCDEDIDLLVISSQMHDLGKLCIPDEILHKPAKLTKEEFDIIKTHAISGYYILNKCTGKYLETSKLIARNHHEKFNGKGYYGLSGYEIDLFSRIVAIADVFDALASERSYKKAWPIEKIVQLFKEERGEHFDPDLVDIFLNNIDEFIKVQEKYK